MDTFSAGCPSRTVLDVLANKWVLYVLELLLSVDRPMRFNEVRRAVEGVTQKSLTKTLRALERDGLIDRRVHATVPPRVEYRLTDLGHEAGHLLANINRWARRNADQIIDARAAFDTTSAAGEPVATQWTVRR